MRKNITGLVLCTVLIVFLAAVCIVYLSFFDDRIFLENDTKFPVNATLYIDPNNNILLK